MLYNGMPLVNSNGYNLTDVDKWLGCIVVQDKIDEVVMFDTVACVMGLDSENLSQKKIEKCISSRKMDLNGVKKCATGDTAIVLGHRFYQEATMMNRFFAYPTLKVGSEFIRYWTNSKYFICDVIGAQAPDYCKGIDGDTFRR
mmetsp:Transcript_28320/g.24243  ORF Transcript_28320/g.24243 Transcript_28320/m.24243 type:complete len:143 (-) Transcript_28320:37-465(-)